MHEEIKKIDTKTMYKMIQALFKYDYFSTRCFVEVLIQNRTDEEEIKKLKKIDELLFEQKGEEVKKLVEDCINNRFKD